MKPGVSGYTGNKGPDRNLPLTPVKRKETYYKSGCTIHVPSVIDTYGGINVKMQEEAL